MQSKSFLAALLMLVQISHAMPHFELNAPAPLPSTNNASQPPTNDDSKTSEDNAPLFPNINLPEASPDSPEYAQIKQLYDAINQIFAKYNLASQPVSDGKDDRMGILGGASNEQSIKQAPLSLLQSSPSVTQPPKEQAKEQPKEQKKEQPKENPKEEKKEQPKEQPQPQNMPGNSGSNVGSTDKFNPAEFTKLVNEFRKENGAPPIELKEALSKDALDHAKYMKGINDLTHDRAPGDKISDKLKQYGFNTNGAIAENIVQGAMDTKSIFESWKGSKGHADNMKNPAYKYMGVASYKEFASQEFSG